jgi:hypothetical protein
MRLTLGLIAEAANTTSDGKLNILGEFNIILTTQFPMTYPSLALVFRLEADGSEPADHRFHVRLLDEDNNLVRPVGDGGMTLGPSGYEGIPRRIQGVIPIRMATFERAGTYTFEFLVDNDRPEMICPPIELHVVQANPQ